MHGEDSGPVMGLGRRRAPVHVPVYPEIFTCYQKVLGPTATLLWLNLRYLAEHGGGLSFADAAEFARQGLGLDPESLERELARLVEWGLVGSAGDGGTVLIHEPLDEESFQVLAEEFAAAREQAAAMLDGEGEAGGGGRDGEGGGDGPDAAVEDDLARDLESVFELYQQRIGLLGPMQYEKLRFWVEQMGMDAAVVAMAVDETARSAENPRINYLEGILRNWHNDGLRTAADLVRHLSREKALEARPKAPAEAEASGARPAEGSAVPAPVPASGPPRSQRRFGASRPPGREAGGGSYEGAPNADAYRKVDTELVKRWKEMYPDEYDDE